MQLVLVLLVCGLACEVALQCDSGRAPQVCHVSTDILFSMYFTRFYVIYRGCGSYAIYYYAKHYVLEKMMI